MSINVNALHRKGNSIIVSAWYSKYDKNKVAVYVYILYKRFFGFIEIFFYMYENEGVHLTLSLHHSDLTDIFMVSSGPP